MSGTDWFQVASVLVLVLLVGVLGASEVSITRMSLVRAYRFRDERRRGGASLARIAERPAPYLNVVLLLTLLATIGGTTLATSFAVRTIGQQGLGEVVATFAMTILLFVFADVTPKTFAIQQTDRVALLLAPAIVAVHRLVGPAATGLVRFANLVMPGRGLPQGPFITESEIRHLAEIAVEGGELEEQEKEMIHQVFDFGDTVVREVMVPRPDVVSIAADRSLRDVEALVVEAGFSRIPVYEKDLDGVIGVVFAKDVLKAVYQGRDGTPLRSIVRAPRFVPESKNVAELLREMQQGKFHFALATDEYGSVSGIVTLEDLLEEIVGEIHDEFDLAETPIVPLGDDRWRVSGKVAIDEAGEALEAEFPEDGFDTIAGFVLDLAGSIPRPGEEVRWLNFVFHVEQVKGRRIERILVTREPVPDDAEDDGSDDGDDRE
ncbi:MAG: hemolysin family protein [Actinomycetota bacterium]